MFKDTLLQFRYQYIENYIHRIELTMKRMPNYAWRISYTDKIQSVQSISNV